MKRKHGQSLHLKGGRPLPERTETNTKREVVAQGAQFEGDVVRVPAGFKVTGIGVFRRRIGGAE